MGQIISISYITGSLGTGQALEQNLSYIPQDTGDYKVEKFLWSDMNEPTALTVKPEAKIINVVQTSEQQIQETPQQTVQTELTASTSKSSYNAGDTILVTGTASSDYEYNQPVTIQIINPQGNIVSISQVQPNSYNVFSQSIATSLGDLWSDAGVYQIMIQHGAKETGTIFNFSGSNSVAPPPPPPLPVPEPVVFENTTTIMMVQGSYVPGCEPDCFIPSFAGVPSDSYVTWENTDTAPHTVTAGDPGDGPSGAFDSSLIMSGQNFSVKLDDGDYPYFCMIHPWRTGVVSVGAYEPVPQPIETVQELVFSTSKTSYEYGDYIAVTGSWTGDVVPGLYATIQIFYQNNQIAISQTNVFNSGFFSETFRAAGPTWTQDGEYTIRVEYGSQPSQQQTFYLSGISQDCIYEFEIEKPGADTIDVPIACYQRGEPFPQLGERFDSSLVMPGSLYTTQSFNEPGFVAYMCMVHPWMTGLIIVEDEGADTQSIQLNPLLTPAFADHALNTTVENAQGSSTPGCEPDCFIPSVATVGVGGQVTFMNNDSAAHTATSYLSYFGSDHGIIAPEPLPEPEFIFRFDYPTVTDTFGNAISSISPDQQVDINFYVENKKPDGTSQQFYIWFEENTRVDEPFPLAPDWDNENLIGPFTALVDRPQIIQIPWTPQSSGNINNMFRIASVHENFLVGGYLLAQELELERFVEYHYEPVPASGQIAIVENAQGSSTPGCEPDCFLPSTITIGVGGQVKFLNNDSAAHTSTFASYVGADDTGAVWDSGLFMPGSSYTTPPLAAGEYPYFCMVHPWMTGLVIVEDEGTEDYDQVLPSENGTLNIGLSVVPEAEANSVSKLHIGWIKPGFNKIQEHIDYRITVIKDGQNVFGPIPLTHTSIGTVKIPVEFTSNGEHQVKVEMEGILFQPIPLETTYFTVNVGEGHGHGDMDMEMQTLTAADISIDVTDGAKVGEQIAINVTINGTHVNYDIVATHNGETILDESGNHSHTGEGSHTTSALTADASDDNPIDITVTFQGFGFPGDEMTGPIGLTNNAQVIQEPEPTFINVGTESMSYSTGDMINITGNSTNTSTTITITITNSTSTLGTLNITSASSGLFSTIWQIPSGMASGAYTMTASDGILTNSTSFSVTSPATTDYPLTITTLHIYQDGSNTRYNVIGEAPPSTTLTFQVIAPDGSIDGTASASTGDPAYNHDGLIFNPESGSGWIMKICTPTNQCLEYTFGIGGSSGDYPVLISDTGSSKKPAIAMSGEKVHVTWIKESGPQEIHYKRSIDGGDTFGDTIVIGSSTTAEGPKIAVSGNDVHIVWNDGAPFAKYAKSTDGGVTFTTVDIFTGAQASGQSGEIRWPDVSVSGDTVHMVGVAAYYPSYPNWSGVHQKSTDGGQTFDLRTVYSGESIAIPSISHSGDNVYIAWERQHLTGQDPPPGSNPDSEPMFVKSTNGGASFSSQSAILSGGSWVYTGYFDIVSSGGNVHIVNNSENGFDYWRSTDNGNTFSSVLSDLTTTWSGSQGYYGYPSIATSGPDVYIAYAPQTDDVFFVKSTDSGQTFAAPIELPGNYHPAIAASGNIIVIAYETNNGGIYLLKSTDRGQDQFFGP